MTWQADVDELQRRADIARQMGGPDAVAFHKGRGKLTVRERLDLLADPGSFRETGVLAGKPTWDGTELESLTQQIRSPVCSRSKASCRACGRLHDPRRFGDGAWR